MVNPFVVHALQVWVLQKVSILLFSIVKVLNGNEAVTIFGLEGMTKKSSEYCKTRELSDLNLESEVC